MLALKKQFPFVERETELDLRGYLEEYKYTPDIRTLQMGKHWYVFEYGEAMKEHREHGDFAENGVKLVGGAFTKYANLVMYKKDLGLHSFPIALPGMPKAPGIWFKTPSNEPLTSNLHRVDRVIHPFHSKSSPGRIKGELYEVSGARAIIELDKRRENTVSFRRIRMAILFPYTRSVWNPETGSWVSEEHMQTVFAWFYVGIKKYWDGILDAGYSSRLVRRFQHVANRTEYASHNMGDYFFYSKLELIDDEDRNGGKVPL